MLALTDYQYLRVGITSCSRDARKLAGRGSVKILKRSDVPKKTVDILIDALDPINERIAQMQNRAMIGD